MAIQYSKDCNSVQHVMALRAGGDTVEPVAEQAADRHLRECGKCREQAALLSLAVARLQAAASDEDAVESINVVPSANSGQSASSIHRASRGERASLWPRIERQLAWEATASRRTIAYREHVLAKWLPRAAALAASVAIVASAAMPYASMWQADQASRGSFAGGSPVINSGGMSVGTPVGFQGQSAEDAKTSRKHREGAPRGNVFKDGIPVLNPQPKFIER